MKSDRFYSLQSVLSGNTYTEEQTCTVCPKTGEALDVVYDYDRIRSTLNIQALRSAPLTATKYLPFYPLNDLRHLVSLSEGGTPLLHARNIGEQLNLPHLHIKNEGANPTGVFKDRGSLVELTKARELGANAVCCASTGNMAASVSAYAAVAGLPCYVLVPEGTPMGKLGQTLSYGARVIQVRGTYADCVTLCEEMARTQGFYLAGDYAFRLEGHKSIAYEICEQLLWRVPDVVICPVGCGTNIAAIWKGFKEFKEFGLIDALPRMIAVQPENVPTIAEAWRQKKDRCIVVEKPSTVASAVGIGVPQDDVKALRCLYESNGAAETASEHEILLAEHNLARLESLFVEPSSAIPVAVLERLMNKKVIQNDDIVVCIATGTGLKDPKTAISLLPDPPVLEPRFEEVQRYLDMKLYEMKGSLDQAVVLFKQIPTKSDLKNTLKKEFGVDFDQQITDGIFTTLSAFLEKGRSVTRADLQNMIESFLNEFSVKQKVLQIDDFSVSDSRHEQADARVALTFHGEKHEVEGKGDGAVDALVEAIKCITADDSLNVRLTDYTVGIATEGAEAVVKVKMTLVDANGNKVVATGTSPDVIVASVDAYEKGYNILYWKNGG